MGLEYGAVEEWFYKAAQKQQLLGGGWSWRKMNKQTQRCQSIILYSSHKLEEFKMRSENAWKMIAPTKAGEFKAHYFCKCGENRILPLQNNDYPDYNCKNCQNDYFLTYEKFQDLQQHMYSKDFNITCTLLKSERYRCLSSIYIPRYDNSTASIIFEKKELAKMSLNSDFKIQFHYLDKELKDKKVYDFHSASKFENVILQEMKASLLKYLMNKDRKMMQKIKNYFPDADIHTLEMALFMYKNPQLEDVELFFFQNLLEQFTQTTSLQGLFEEMLYDSPKSIKSAFYKGYKDFLNIAPEYDFIVLELFSNPNFTRELLSIPAENKKLFMGYVKFKEYLNIMHFLKSILNQKQLFTLLKEALSTRDALDKWVDTINMLVKATNNLDVVANELSLNKVNLQTLHDDVARVVNFYLMEEKSKNILKDFDYPQVYLRFETDYKGLQFKLVKNPKQLYEWAQTLHNCLSGYVDKVSQNLTTIIGVYIDDTIAYALEIKQDRLVQAKAKYNKSIPNYDNTIVDEWYASNKQYLCSHR